MAVVLRLVRRQAEHVSGDLHWPDYAREHPAVGEELAWVESVITRLEAIPLEEADRATLREADEALDSASRLVAGLRAYAHAKNLLARRTGADQASSS
jgi:hypothetical protein